MQSLLKKFVLVVLIFSMVLPVINVSAASIEEALFKTEALELFEKEDDDTIDWTKTITRAEFSHAMSKLLRHDSNVVSYPLKDVNESIRFNGDIYNMLMYGLMSGDGNGYFRPNDDITVAEASIVLLRVMGYNFVVSNKKYPSEIISYASSLGLIDDVNAWKEFTRKDFAVMLNNAFDINLMTEKYVGGSDRQFYISDIKFGDVIFDADGEGSAYYGIGVVMQNALSFVDVQYQQLEIDEVIIDGVLYKTGDTNVADLLGMEVRYLAKEREDGYYVLINISPTEDNNVVKFDAVDFCDYTDKTSISYYERGEKLKKVKLDFDTHFIKNYDVIINPSKADFATQCGEFVIIDNDDDNVAETVIIYSYENAVVSGVANNVIALKESFKVNGSRYINLHENNDELLYYITDSDGNTVDVNSINGGNVISVATDRTGKIMKIVVNTSAIVTASLSAAVDHKFVLDDKEYNVFSSEEYKVGNLYDFYLNFKNDIIYFEVADDGEETKYCYVLGVYSEDLSDSYIKLLVSKKVDFGIEINDDDEDNITQIPMLICQNEEIVTLKMADKVRVDGSRVSYDDLVDRISVKDGFYQYELNSDGELRSLESAEYKAGSLYQTFTYNIYDKCFGAGSTAYEAFAINEDSQILCIPTEPSCNEDYMVKNVINKEGNTLGYYVRGYNYDPISKKCGLVVINRDMKYDNLPGVTLDSSKAAIVKDYSLVLTDDDEIVGKIEFAINGEDKEMHFTQTATESVGRLSDGDLFTYTEDYDNKITNVMVIKSISDLNHNFTNQSGLASGASETYGNLLDISFDEIDENTNSLAMEFLIDIDGLEKVISVPQRNKPPIYIYERNNIRNGGIEDIVPGTDKVYIFMSNAKTVAAIVVVK